MSRLAGGALLLVVTAAACGHDRTPAPAARETVVSVPFDTVAQASSFRTWAMESLRELKPGVSLGQWRQAHTTDVEFAYMVMYSAGPFCAQLVTHARLPGGTLATRYAFFYGPLPPDSYPPRLPDSAVRLERDCRLAMMVVSAQLPPASDTMLPGLEDDLRARFRSGPPLAPNVDGGWFSDLPIRWRADSATVGLGRPLESDEGSDAVRQAESIVVMAALPATDSVWRFTYETPDWEAWHAHLLARLRASGSMLDERNWIDSLRQMTLTGPMREFLLVMDMETASRECDVNVDSLIDAWERALPAVRDSEMIAAFHFLLGAAYGYRMSPVAAAQDRDRIQAIAHYRAALARDPGRRHPEGRRASFDLWRLVAGLHPWLPHFFFTGCGD